MKKIVRYIRDYFNDQWNSRLFLFVAAFLIFSFSINYIFDLEAIVIRQWQNPIAQFVFYFFFFALPFFITILAYATVTKRSAFLRDQHFWILGTVCFILLAAYISLHNVPSYLYRNAPEVFNVLPREMHWYSVRYAANLFPGLIIFFPVAAYWYSKDKATSRLYGFNSSNINLTTYAAILLILLPIVLAASFSKDFQAAYPRYKFGFPHGLVGGERVAMVGLFEICYGIDFVFVEFFFRGFMVMAFARYLGKGSILPMVVVYAFIHFQKPMGEAIGSIGGGLALGIISYETRSLYGGIILHLGVAYMMEMAGGIQWLMR